MLVDINQVAESPLPTNLQEFVSIYMPLKKRDKDNTAALKLQQTLGVAWQMNLAQCNISLLNNLSIARVRASSQPHANAWLTCSPTRSELRIPDQVYRTAVCLRLNFDPVFCDPASKVKLLCANCNVSLLDDPFHRLHCKYESSRGRRMQHDHVVSRIVSFARACGHHAVREPGFFRDEDSNVHPDGYIHWSDGSHMLFDVRGFDPLAPTHVNTNPRTVSDAAGVLKMNKYRETGKVSYPDIQFTPFIFDTLGGLSKSAVSLLQRLAKLGPISSFRDWSKLFTNELAAIAVSIQIDNAAIIHSSFASARP